MIFQLINEHMAVALNYGMFRRKELNNTAKHIMFYNMGASSSWATIVSTLPYVRSFNMTWKEDQ